MRILPNISYGSLLGENLGKAVGGSLAGGLEALTEHKMNQIANQKKVQGLASLGYSPEQAKQLAGLPDQLLQQKLQNDNALRLMQQKEAFTKARENEYINRFNGGSSNQQEFQQNRTEVPDQEMAKYREQLQGYELGNKIFGENAPQGSLGAPTPPPRKFNGPLLQEGVTSKKGFLTPQELGIPTPTNRKELNDYIKQAIKQKNEERRELSKEKLANKKLSFAEQKEINKETLPYFNEVLKEEKSSKKIDLLTSRMLNLVDKGKLPDPVWYKQLKDLEDSLTPLKSISAGASAGAIVGGAGGLILGPAGSVAAGALGSALGSAIGGLVGLASSQKVKKMRGELIKEFPDTEEFEKLSSEFISGAKALFGNRVTDLDLKAFMQTVPQLINSDVGKKAIIRNIKILNEASHLRYNTMNQIIKENGGNRPKNLALLVDERASDELDRLAKEFIG